MKRRKGGGVREWGAAQKCKLPSRLDDGEGEEGGRKMSVNEERR